MQCSWHSRTCLPRTSTVQGLPVGRGFSLRIFRFVIASDSEAISVLSNVDDQML